jgi:putative endonuclease
LQTIFDMKTGGIVYIITNRYRTVLYIGVTNDIRRRMLEHKKRINKGFAQKYNCVDLLYFESFWDIADAIQRETVIKRWKRNWKLELIKKENPTLVDLSAEWFDEHGNLKENTLLHH